MRCGEELCLRVEKTQTPSFEPPSGALTICVKPDAFAHWLELAQAMYYAYHWRGPARNPNISALMFLSRRDQIREALTISAASGEAVCATLGPKETLEQTRRGEPHYPEGPFDPWKITKFALDLVT